MERALKNACGYRISYKMVFFSKQSRHALGLTLSSLILKTLLGTSYIDQNWDSGIKSKEDLCLACSKAWKSYTEGSWTEYMNTRVYECCSRAGNGLYL